MGKRHSPASGRYSTRTIRSQRLLLICNKDPLIRDGQGIHRLLTARPSFSAAKQIRMKT